MSVYLVKAGGGGTQWYIAYVEARCDIPHMIYNGMQVLLLAHVKSPSMHVYLHRKSILHALLHHNESFIWNRLEWLSLLPGFWEKLNMHACFTLMHHVDLGLAD